MAISASSRKRLLLGGPVIRSSQARSPFAPLSEKRGAIHSPLSDSPAFGLEGFFGICRSFMLRRASILRGGSWPARRISSVTLRGDRDHCSRSPNFTVEDGRKNGSARIQRGRSTRYQLFACLLPDLTYRRSNQVKATTIRMERVKAMTAAKTSCSRIQSSRNMRKA